MKRAIIGVVAAVLLAAVGTTALVAFVRGAEDRALAGQETVEVLVVSDHVARGTPAEELATRVVSERIPAKVRPAGTVVTLDDLEGKVATVDLVAGEQLLAARFAEPTALADGQAIPAPEGLQEVTISLDPQRAVGGRLAPGDTVGLIASFNLSDQRTDEEIANEEQEHLRQELSQTTKMLLQKLLVTAVHVEQLPPTPDEAEGAPSGPALAPTGNLLITLAVDVPQAERVVFAAEHGTVWLTAEDVEADETGSRLRTPRIIYDD